MEIKKFEGKDIDTVVELWYKTSIIAHNFIPNNYWGKNKEAMASIYLPNSETYLAITQGKIIGFISMAENYLAAIFVDSKTQGKGIGKTLLNFVKNKRTIIQLKVYLKNTKAVAFYKSHDFKIISEDTDEETGEKEFLMEWKKRK